MYYDIPNNESLLIVLLLMKLTQYKDDLVDQHNNFENKQEVLDFHCLQTG